jgi:adenylosuccinate synthase
MIERKIDVKGLQTGDEGKGVRVLGISRKATALTPEILESYPVIVFRYNGGGNAGHTLWIKDLEYKHHQVPCGVHVRGVYNLIGEACCLDSIKIVREVTELQEKGVKITPENFGIASNCHMTLGFHTEEDAKNLEKEEHTSTGKGIKQTAVDKYGRVGIRFEEFLDRDTFIGILTDRFPNGVGQKSQGVQDFAAAYDEARELLAPFSVLQSDVLGRSDVHTLIGEGAQGFRLDVDRGLYPGVTSSNPSRAPFRTDLVLGTVKFYESSVGHERPFVSQMNPELEAIVREKWGEKGTTTGKKRDLGWFDAVAVKHAIESTDTDYLIGSCGDRLECLYEMGEKVRIVVAYKIGEKIYESWDKSFHNRKTLYNAEPVFEEFYPWKRFVGDEGCLTENAHRFIDRIQELTGREFVLLGTGPGEEDVIELKDVLRMGSHLIYDKIL